MHPKSGVETVQLEPTNALGVGDDLLYRRSTRIQDGTQTDHCEQYTWKACLGIFSVVGMTGSSFPKDGGGLTLKLD